MAGLPTQRHWCALAGALVLCLASCEERPFPPRDEGIDFGEDVGDEESGDGDPGDGDGDGDVAESGEPKCEAIVDSLIITDETEPESVACVERVRGDLMIGPTTALFDLELLASLRQVDGATHIVGNLALTTVTGLGALEQTTWLHVRRNRNLSDLHGLDGLTAVEHVTIADNAGMTSLAGLPAGLAPWTLEIADNDLLASLDGLPEFIAPGSGQPLAVDVERNPSLIDLGGLADCCADQPLDLSLVDNVALPDLGGLEPFARLDSLRLIDNPLLGDLDGLDNLTELDVLEIAYDHCAAGEPKLATLDGAPLLFAVDVVAIEWAPKLVSLAGLAGLGSLDKLVIRNNEMLAWAAVVELAAQTQPIVNESCGGLGGPSCAIETCPMF